MSRFSRFPWSSLNFEGWLVATIVIWFELNPQEIQLNTFKIIMVNIAVTHNGVEQFSEGIKKDNFVLCSIWCSFFRFLAIYILWRVIYSSLNVSGHLIPCTKEWRVYGSKTWHMYGYLKALKQQHEATLLK